MTICVVCENLPFIIDVDNYFSIFYMCLKRRVVIYVKINIFTLNAYIAVFVWLDQRLKAVHITMYAHSPHYATEAIRRVA